MSKPKDLSAPRPRSSQPAPAAADPRDLASRCQSSLALQILLEVSDHPILLLGPDDLTVAVSRSLRESLDHPTEVDLVGLRHGEIIRCAWATQCTMPCGQADTCRQCGIQAAISECRKKGTTVVREALLSLDGHGLRAFGEFRIQATPVLQEQDELVVLSLIDLSDRRRRESLENFFFHQVLNLVNGLEGTVRILSAEPESAPHLVQQLSDFTEQLAQEVMGRRILLQAENGSLRVEPQEVELSEIMESLQAFFRNHDVAHRRRMILRQARPERFRTDPSLLLRILVDLVMNAFEATPAGSAVEVDYRRGPLERRFLVRNPGTIPADVADRIFERSFSTKAAGGHGLGTFGIRLLAERYLGGTVEFATDASGTCFTLRLPAPEPLPEAESLAEWNTPAASQEPGAAGRQKLGTVLIVDDTKVIRHLVQAILSRDFQVLLAESGPEALRLSQELHPDLVVLDVMMPEMDGYSVCRRLKADPRTSEIPIIFLTALAGKSYETKALEAGAIDFITKPINPDVVYARVRNHVEMKQAQDHLKDLSLQDGLTGIANRRAFDKALEHEWRRGLRSRSALSIIMGDVDYFKRYNDSLGHQQGDVCLRAIARVFNSAVRRPSDTSARYGGEEFVCVLGDTEAWGALQVAEKIRIGVESLALPHPDSDLGPHVTVSLGVATAIPAPGQSPLALVEEADRRLYEAKRTGRNRVVGSDEG